MSVKGRGARLSSDLRQQAKKVCLKGDLNLSLHRFSRMLLQQETGDKDQGPAAIKNLTLEGK
jgi:hypothetical protein